MGPWARHAEALLDVAAECQGAVETLVALQAVQRNVAHPAVQRNVAHQAVLRNLQNGHQGAAASAGKVPTTPALQVAMTISGPDTRNIGAATAGSDRRP